MTRRVLVTGATGYIGGRLVPRLLDVGFEVACLARSRRKIEDRSWADRKGLEVLVGDVGDAESLAPAMAGVETAFYFVHSMMAAGAAYAAEDLRLAETFAQAAERAGVKRIVYLGGPSASAKEKCS